MRKSKSHILDILKLIRNLRKTEFEIAANLYKVSSWGGAVKMGLLFLSLKAKVKVGHNHKGFGFFINKKVPGNTFQNQHSVDAMMDIALMAGGIPNDKGTEVFWGKKNEERCKHLYQDESNELQRIKIGINPGGDRPSRRWNPDKYALVADRLIEHFNAQIVLLGGPGEEHIAQHVQNKMKNEATNLSGKLTLNDLIYIINQFDLLLTNDSGPMHIAAAVKTPVVAIFGPENPSLMHPYTSSNLFKIAYKAVECRPCNKTNCSRPICLDLITPEEVSKKCFEILKNKLKSGKSDEH
ncbi:MAG: glycosyltransferase family 9 protein [Candidatus Aminicenantes bacterium]|nr:MAG: glycosyltransferase family 9 protein [Candidatus Aminicenantes bacterium]